LESEPGAWSLSDKAMMDQVVRCCCLSWCASRFEVFYLFLVDVPWCRAWNYGFWTCLGTFRLRILYHSRMKRFGRLYICLQRIKKLKIGSVEKLLQYSPKIRDRNINLSKNYNI
jgi:hypothetical protein